MRESVPSLQLASQTHQPFRHERDYSFVFDAVPFAVEFRP